MGIEHDVYYNLAERLDEAFSEIDSDVCADLRKNDGEYIKIHREALKLAEYFPVIPQIVEGDGDVSPSADESRALARYLKLKMELENVERKHIYFRGHMDNYHYLKKIGAI